MQSACHTDIHDVPLKNTNLLYDHNCLVWGIVLTVARIIFSQQIGFVAGKFAQHASQDRLIESAWRTIVYTSICLFCSVFAFEPVVGFFQNTTTIWVNHGETVPYVIQILYCIYASVYLHELLSAIILDNPSSDTWAMVVHHLTTLFLLELSWRWHFTNVGVSIMVLHDVSDCFLHAAKCMNYCKRKIWADAFFILFAGSFVVLRLGVLPMKIILSMLTEACPLLLCKPQSCYKLAWFWLFVLPVCVLQSLHFFWGWKIWLVIKKKQQDDVLQDVRELKKE